MFHASAVEIDGYAVAFMGPAGRGKSTLAASFATTGFRFLTDDGLAMTLENDHVLAAPSHPSIRLWEDSEAALITQRALRAPPIQYSSKARVLAGEDIAFCAEARPLHNVYFVGESDVSEARFEEVGSSRAVEELVRNSFLLDIEEKESLATHFEELVKLAHHRRYFRFDFPRRYSALASVRQSIVAHVRGVPPLA